MDIMTYAAPAFLLLIAIEIISSLKKGKKRYELNDTVNNFATSILEEASALPFKGAIFYSYIALYENFSLMRQPSDSVLSWVLLWLGVDFCYYWFHRAAHRCSFLWIGHSVHHQSQHYNLSVALRQGVVQAFTSWGFYLPLALLGFAPWMFMLVFSLNTVYQFWLHTESIRSLGWLELLLNTPSHHRVHHGQNPQYIDKNYAGSLIVWDKCFGTFEPEVEPVHYGVTEPLDSWNPFYANVKVIKDLVYYGRELNTFKDRILAFIMPPEWIIKKLQTQGTVVSKPHTTINRRSEQKMYKILNTVLAIGLYLFIALSPTNTVAANLSAAALLALTLFILGKISNGGAAVFLLELTRCFLLSLLLFLLAVPPLWVALSGLLFASFNLALLQRKTDVRQGALSVEA